MTRTSDAHAFVARLRRLGGLYGVLVPIAVSRRLGGRGNVPVAGVLEGQALRTTIMPRKGGGHVLFVSRDVRLAIRARIGSRLRVELRVDSAPREYPLPDDLASALRDEGVLEAFSWVASSKRREVLRWIDAAVHEATREKRIARAVEIAHEAREKRVDRGM